MTCLSSLAGPGLIGPLDRGMLTELNILSLETGGHFERSESPEWPNVWRL